VNIWRISKDYLVTTNVPTVETLVNIACFRSFGLCLVLERKNGELTVLAEKCYFSV